MKNLNAYAENLTPEQKANLDAFDGFLLELSIKDYINKPLTISKAGKVDTSIVIDGKLRRLECKQNGGDFRHECKGSTYIAYAVYIEENKPLNQQFGYVMPMEVFKACGYALNHIRKEKKDADGMVKMSLQTLYNYKKGDFHGAKAFKLSAMWEANGAIPFKDFFTEQG